MKDGRIGRKQSKIWELSKDDLTKLVQKSHSFTEILNYFKITNNGACMRTLKKILNFYLIDYSHIKAGSSNKFRYKIEYKNYIKQWKANKKKGWTGKNFQISAYIKKYLREKYKDKCQHCGWNEIHPITKKIPLQVDHIDGNASNCKENNLRLLCPNCHSLTSTFGHLNKFSCRRCRYSDKSSTQLW